MKVKALEYSVSRPVEKCYPSAGAYPSVCEGCGNAQQPGRDRFHPGPVTTIVVQFYTTDEVPDDLNLEDLDDSFPDIQATEVEKNYGIDSALGLDLTSDMCAVEAKFYIHHVMSFAAK